MLIANIEPVQYFNQTATKLTCYVTYYDMKAMNCTLYWNLLNSGESMIFNDIWHLPPEVLQNWGSDDTYLLQALADKMEFTITSFE